MDSQIRKKLLRLKDPEEQQRCKDMRYFYNNYCKQGWEPEMTEREFAIVLQLYSTMSGRLRKLFCSMARISNKLDIKD